MQIFLVNKYFSWKIFSYKFSIPSKSCISEKLGLLEQREQKLTIFVVVVVCNTWHPEIDDFRYRKLCEYTLKGMRWKCGLKKTFSIPQRDALELSGSWNILKHWKRGSCFFSGWKREWRKKSLTPPTERGSPPRLLPPPPPPPQAHYFPTSNVTRVVTVGEERWRGRPPSLRTTGIEKEA